MKVRVIAGSQQRSTGQPPLSAILGDDAVCNKLERVLPAPSVSQAALETLSLSLHCIDGFCTSELECFGIASKLTMQQICVGRLTSALSIWAQLNIAYPPTGAQKKLEIDEDSKL